MFYSTIKWSEVSGNKARIRCNLNHGKSFELLDQCKWDARRKPTLTFIIGVRPFERNQLYSEDMWEQVALNFRFFFLIKAGRRIKYDYHRRLELQFSYSFIIFDASLHNIHYAWIHYPLQHTEMEI